jgi:hypothetical protein
MATQTLKAPPITVEQYEGFEGFPGLRDELSTEKLFCRHCLNLCISKFPKTSLVC